jgi:hypothetical protein
MKVITVSPRSKALSDLLKKARSANVLLRSAEGEQFVLAKVGGVQAFYVGSSEDFAKEVKATRANKKFMKFLDQRGAQAKAGKGIRHEAVRKRLGLD